MNTATMYLGWFVIAVLSIALAAFAVCAAASLCAKALERFEWAVDAKTRRELGRTISASGWWFSESPDTSLAIRILGQRLMESGSADADQWREQWRKGRQLPTTVSGNQ